MANPPTIDDREKILNLAWSQRGVHESPPFSNNVKYSDWWGFHAAWCAMFASWCFYSVLGYSPFPATTRKGFAHCSTGADWFQRNGLWLSKNSTPPRCSLAFYDFGQWPRAGHVGITINRMSDGRDHNIEGNTNGGGSRDGGSVMEHFRYRNSLVGFGIIPFANVPQDEEFLMALSDVEQRELLTKVRKIEDQSNQNTLRIAKVEAVLDGKGHTPQDPNGVAKGTMLGRIRDSCERIEANVR